MIFWEHGKAAFGGGASGVLAGFPPSREPMRFLGFPGGFLEEPHCTSFCETGPAKSEGKRFLDIGSGSSRRGLEEPLVEFSTGFVNLTSMNSMGSASDLENFFALVPLAEADDPTIAPADAALAHVPFDFVVGELLLPAGPYYLHTTEIPGMLALRPNGSKYPAALVQEIRCERDTPKLLFYRQENLYFLAQVLAGEN